MDTPKRLLRANNFFSLASIGIILFSWFALILGVSGIFIFPLIIFGFSLIGTLVVFLLIKTFSLLDFFERISVVALVAIACVSVFSTDPTVFTGRDQGSIASAAIMLAEQHSFTISLPVADTFFSIYGPGKAYNFPGFFYTNDGHLLTQFPLAYTAWIGSFYLLFDLHGLALANGILFVFSCLSFYFLLRYCTDRFFSFFGSLLFAASFLPVWFIKSTLSENLALFLFIFLSLSLIRLKQTGSFLHYCATLSAIGLFCFTRIEGFLILPLVLILLVRFPRVRHIWRVYPKKSILIPAILFPLTFIATLSDTTPFYITIGKALHNFLSGFNDSVAIIATHSSPLLSLATLFLSYGLILIVLAGFIGIAFLLYRRQYTLLIPTLLALPTFLYFLFPNISPDHPWMLRRYLPTLYPVLVFSTITALALFLSQKKVFPVEISHMKGRHRLLATFFLLGLLAFQGTAWYRALLTYENVGLLEKTEQASQSFGSRDLVLIDRDTTGSNFAMISGPLQTMYHKNAVYFFNPEDLRKIDRSLYERVWLVVPFIKADQWKKDLPDFSLNQKSVLSFGSISLGASSTNTDSPIHFPEITPYNNLAVFFEVE